jgi:hypothetical protein
MSKTGKQDRDEAIARLRDLLHPGDTVHTLLRHVSRSGMSRSISVIIAAPADYRNELGDTYEPVDISYFVAAATGMSLDTRHDGVRIGGCGMDMGFALVYGLSHALWPDGFGCIGEGCPANDHSNGDRDYTPHAVQYTADDCPGRPCGDSCDHRSGEGREHWHAHAGGYALRHRWL